MCMLLVPVSILAEMPGSKPQGRLAPACSDDPQCRWVVRFQPTAPAREHEAVKAVLGKLTPVQPIQFSGNRASVLVERESNYEVVMLVKDERGWRIVDVMKGASQKESALSGGSND